MGYRGLGDFRSLSRATSSPRRSLKAGAAPWPCENREETSITARAHSSERQRQAGGGEFTSIHLQMRDLGDPGEERCPSELRSASSAQTSSSRRASGCEEGHEAEERALGSLVRSGLCGSERGGSEY